MGMLRVADRCGSLRPMFLALLACTGPSDPVVPADTVPPDVSETGTPPTDPTEPVDTAEPTDTGETAFVPPCDAIEVVFFDLGDTLVAFDGDLFQPRPGAAETIAALQAAGVRLGVVTNTTPGWDLQDLRDVLATPSMLDAFEVVLLSSQASSPPKPSAAIYAEAHALLVDGPPIEQTAFVTETLDDIADQAVAPTEGARAAGMFGVWLGDGPTPLADDVIDPDDLLALATADWLSCP